MHMHMCCVCAFLVYFPLHQGVTQQRRKKNVLPFTGYVHTASLQYVYNDFLTKSWEKCEECLARYMLFQ